MSDRPNVSDRGGASRYDVKPVYDHGDGRIVDSRLGDVRKLTREDISDLGEKYGVEAAASAIAAAAVKQLESIKLEVDRLPSGTRLRRVQDAPELTPEDHDWLDHVARARQAQAAVHDELRREAIDRLGTMIVEQCGGDEREAEAILRSLGDERVSALLKVHTRDRRKALARMLEMMAKAPKDGD